MFVAGEVDSVFAESKNEALRHKWIESERAKCDLGESAIQQWVKEHWWGYLRARWVEHIEGTKLWKEFDPDDFGLLKREFHEHGLLLDRILDRLKMGQENLDVITWAVRWNLPTEKVLEILAALDINKCRLSHRFDD